MSDSRQPYWIDNLYGMNNRQLVDEIPDYSSILLKNVTLVRPGSWTKRSGTDMLSTTQAGNGIQGLTTYVEQDGDYTIRAVRSTDLDTYSSVTDTWTPIDSAQFAGGNTQQQTTQDSGQALDEDYWYSQSFTTGAAGTLSSVAIMCRMVANTSPNYGSVDVCLYSDSAGSPGSLMSNIGTISVADASNTYRYLMPNVTVANATVYHLVLKNMTSANDDTGTTFPSTTADDDSVGTVEWNDVDGVEQVSGEAGLGLAGGETSHYLKATNFGFSIPTDATITGIRVKMYRYAVTFPGGAIGDSTVKLVKAGSVTGDNADNENWPSSPTFVYFGGPTDMWGTTWTPAQINSSDFGMVISAEGSGVGGSAFIKQILVTVYYTVPVQLRYNSAGGYASGTYKTSANEGSSWTDTSDDWAFKATVTASGAGAGIHSVNFLGRVYHVSGNDLLCYETGGTCTDVGTGNDRLMATSIGVAQNTLFVGNITYANGSTQTWNDRVYMSKYWYDGENNTPTHQFWEDTEGSLANSTRYFTVRNPVKGLFSYKDLMHIFTYDTCYIYDVSAPVTVGVVKLFDRGLAGPRAITECNGYMIFMGPDARIWKFGGADLPSEVSYEIEDDQGLQAVINSIDKSNIASVSAGSIGNQVFFSVGNLTLYGEGIENAVLRGLLSQDGRRIFWSIDSYPVRPTVFHKTTIDNEEVLLFGSANADDVYIMNTGTTDEDASGTVAIESYGKTKFYNMGLPLHTKYPGKLFVKYEPQSASSTYLRVRFATDGNLTYEEVSNPDGTSALTDYGTVDMYDANSATNMDAIKVLNFPPGTDFRTLSLEFGNLQSGEEFQIKGFGIEIAEVIPLDIKPSSAK